MSDLQKEREIPVFTVWKNNAILKNIFLINSPPILDNNSNNNQDFEETLVVGRHPDCDIRLEHPSISRFHLRIHSLPASKSLFLTDLSSVHGTWVSDKRIEPDIRTKVGEGDRLRIGGSSRVYKLHWIPLSQAYDVSQSFVPPLDFVEQQEDEDEIIKNEISEGLKDEESHNVDDISDDIIKGLEALDFCGDDHQMVEEKILPQSPPLQPQKLVSVKNEAIELADSDFESLESLRLDENSIDVDQKDMLIAPPIRHENFESGGVEPVAPTLEGLSDISRELEQNEMLPVPLVHNEDLKDEDVESVDSILEGLVPLFMGENWEWIGLEENYLPCPTEDHPQSSDGDHLMLDHMEFSTQVNVDSMTAKGTQEFVPDILGEDSQDSAWSFWSAGGLRNTECDHPVMENENIEEVSKSFVTNSSDLHSSTKENGDSQLWSFWSGKMGIESVCSALSDTEPFSEAENKSMANGCLSSSLNSLKSQKSAHSLWSGRGKLESVCSALSDIEPFSEAENKSMANGCLSSSLNSLKSQKSAHSLWSGRGKLESVCSALSDTEPFSEAENKSMTNGCLSSSLNSLKSQKSARSIWQGRGKLESIGFSLSDAESLSASENECCGDGYQSPKSLSSVKGRLGSPLMMSDQNPIDSIWSRRGKLDSVPLVLTSKTEEKKMKNTEEEVFTPDKENFSPSTHRSMRKFAVLKEINSSSSGKSPLLKMNCIPNNHYENNVSPLSNKENYSPRSRQKLKTASRGSANRVESLKLKERKGRRMPFQSLLANSPQKSNSECHIAEAEAKSGICVNGVTCKTNLQEKCIKEEPRQWNMVVDITTLLNKESRKALQLLEGLKGTRLIIPRIVITELASLKRQVSFFRRNTEVQSALEWIQECMLRTGWWIHVQNSTEEGRPVAPTPPASPHHSQFYAFSGFESQREPFSPTVEDDVLDYALGFRKNNHDGQLVLLSNDLTMKIKAMAEGMICETGDEFRESLVNPFSERFMWTDSSPRGQTWSCADDFVLKQKFYPSSLKMTPKSRDNVKGLKLILLHNSRYHERVTAVQ